MIERINLYKAIQLNDPNNGRYLYIINISILEFNLNEFLLNLDNYLQESIAFIEINENIKKNHNLILSYNFNHLEKSLIYNSLEEIPQNKKHIISLTNIKNLDFFLKKIHNYIILPTNKLIFIGNPFNYTNLKNQNKISFYQTFTTDSINIEYFLPEYDQIFGKIYFDEKSITLSLDKNFPIWNLINLTTVRNLLKNRNKHGFKKSFGHAAIVGGSIGMIGAVILASKAALKSGCGLVTTILPKIGLDPFQSNIPEAMAKVCGEDHLSNLDQLDLNSMDAIGIGCGMGQPPNGLTILKNILSLDLPLVIDADGLNCLSQIENFQNLLPRKTILTPHVGEFDRLFGKSKNTKARLKIAKKFADKFDVIIVLKGAHTCIIGKDEPLSFNITGNSGLATAGSGDTLTGIITSLLAQKYEPYDAAILGVYLHGLAADIAVQNSESQESMIASDITNYLGKAFKTLQDDKQ